MEPISLVEEYFGEKFGFYFAFLIHLAGWFLLPAVLALVAMIVASYFIAKNAPGTEDYFLAFLKIQD